MSDPQPPNLCSLPAYPDQPYIDRCVSAVMMDRDFWKDMFKVISTSAEESRNTKKGKVTTQSKGETKFLRCSYDVPFYFKFSF